MLDDALYGFYLVYADRLALEVEEVADEYGVLLLVDKFGVFLVFLVVARACGKLQRGDGFGVPGVLDAVLAVVELSEVRQEVGFALHAESLVVECYGIVGDGLQTDAADGGYVGAEVCLQQTFRQSDALENLGSAV